MLCVLFYCIEKFVKIKKNPKLCWIYDNILIPGCRFLKETQDNGVPFDRTRLQVSQGLMQDNIDEAIKELYNFKEVAKFEEFQGKDFNPNSTVQLRTLLFDFIGLKPTGKKTGTGANSTDAEVLQELGEKHEVPNIFLIFARKARLRIHTLTRSYLSLIEIVGYAQISTYMELLLVACLLVVN